LENDPEFAEFVKANFPEQFGVGAENNNNNEKGGDSSSLSAQDKIVLDLINNPRMYMNEPMKKPLKPKMTPEERATLNDAKFNWRPMDAYIRNPHTESKKYASRGMRDNQQAHSRFIPGVLILGATQGKDAANADIPILTPDQAETSSSRNHSVLIKTPWSLLQREVDRYLTGLEGGRVYNLSVYENDNDSLNEFYEDKNNHNKKVPAADNKNKNNKTPLLTIPVVPKNVNWHPVYSIDMYCINFVKYKPGKTVLTIPFKYVNQEESPALKHECFIIDITRKLDVIIDDGVDIPDYIEVECADLKNKQSIRRDRILLPKGIRFAKSVMKRDYKDYIVGVVVGSNRGMLNAAADADAAAGAK